MAGCRKSKFEKKKPINEKKNARYCARSRILVNQKRYGASKILVVSSTS